jgi:hypothetical protein
MHAWHIILFFGLLVGSVGGFYVGRLIGRDERKQLPRGWE